MESSGLAIRKPPNAWERLISPLIASCAVLAEWGPPQYSEKFEGGCGLEAGKDKVMLERSAKGLLVRAC